MSPSEDLELYDERHFVQLAGPLEPNMADTGGPIPPSTMFACPQEDLGQPVTTNRGNTPPNPAIIRIPTSYHQTLMIS